MNNLNNIIQNTNLKLDPCSININLKALLRALAQNESSYGKNNKPRFEKAYYTGGRYCNKKLIEKFGQSAACSWSSWQIMYPTAVELGFTGNPENLQNDEIALPYIVKFINVRIIKKGPKKIEDIFDAYNSGNFKDNIIPKKYIEDGMKWYNYYLKNPII